MFQFASSPPFVRLKNPRNNYNPPYVQRIAFLDEPAAAQRDQTATVAVPLPIPPQPADVPCFVEGAMVRTPGGKIPIEDLRVGDLVQTRDRGAQPIRWIGTTRKTTDASTAPVIFAPGALTNKDPVHVSPLHRVLLSGWRCNRIAGAEEIITPALSLVNGRDITQAEPGEVTYFHLLFDQHEIITVDRLPLESLHPADMPIAKGNGDARENVVRLFPQLGANPAAYGPKARPEIKPYEARLIRP